LNFNFDAMWAMLSNPIVLGVGGIVILVVFGLITFFIISRMRGGFGRFTKPKDLVQRCISITSANTLVFYKLPICGDRVTDERNQADHFLFSDALIPERDTGQLYLPIDDRAAVPHYPLDPELLKQRYNQAKAAMKHIAAVEDQRQRQDANADARKEQNTEMHKFALVFGFAIALVVVIAIVVMQIV